MKKIAIAREGEYVSAHFGHCEGFEILELKEEGIVNRDFVKNPGHRPGFLPRFLSDMNVNTIISGGMGATAQELFRENDIEVIVGATGKLNDMIDEFVKEGLESSNSVCNEHMHHEHCNG